MCSLFGLIDFKECLSTHTKNKILNTLAREIGRASCRERVLRLV